MQKRWEYAVGGDGIVLVASERNNEFIPVTVPVVS
jgi:hypothetical protein